MYSLVVVLDKEITRMIRVDQQRAGQKKNRLNVAVITSFIHTTGGCDYRDQEKGRNESPATIYLTNRQRYVVTICSIYVGVYSTNTIRRSLWRRRQHKTYINYNGLFLCHVLLLFCHTICILSAMNFTLLTLLAHDQSPPSCRSSVRRCIRVSLATPATEEHCTY